MMLPDSWHGPWSRPQGQSWSVLGKSGFSVADTLAELGVHTAVVGKAAKPELADLVEAHWLQSFTLPSRQKCYPSSDSGRILRLFRPALALAIR